MTDGGGDDARDDGRGPRAGDEAGSGSDEAPSAGGDRPPSAETDGPDPPPATGAGGDPPGSTGHGDRDPPPHRRGGNDVPAPTERPVRWYLQTDHPLVVASRDIVTSVLLVAMIGLALFAVSGVWPPLVAIESGSMEPNMHQGDLVVVAEADRFSSQLATEDGIVTRDRGEEIGHSQFGAPGTVIVYRPDGENRTPIIHRASYHVEDGEDWTETVDPQYLRGQECADLDTCPAEYDGYITRGDANAVYDQVGGQSDVVRPAWIEGRAVSRVPYLGCLRLELSGGEGCDFGRSAS